MLKIANFLLLLFLFCLKLPPDFEVIDFASTKCFYQDQSNLRKTNDKGYLLDKRAHQTFLKEGWSPLQELERAYLLVLLLVLPKKINTNLNYQHIFFSFVKTIRVLEGNRRKIHFLTFILFCYRFKGSSPYHIWLLQWPNKN